MECVLYMGVTLFWCCCNVKRVQHVPLLCTGSEWWGKEMGKEVIYIVNKSCFSIFSLCYCLKSTALFIAVWHAFPQCHFKKGKNKYGNFFVVKIVTQWNHTSSFFFSWWNLKPTRHRFLNLNYACQRLMQSQQNAVQQDVFWWLKESGQRRQGLGTMAFLGQWMAWLAIGLLPRGGSGIWTTYIERHRALKLFA